MGSISGSGRCPGVGNGNPFQYRRLENSMVRGDWRAIVYGVNKALDVTEHTDVYTHEFYRMLEEARNSMGG